MEDTNFEDVTSSLYETTNNYNDPELAKTMIMDFDITALNPKSGSLFLLLQDLYGGSWSIEVLQKWSESKVHNNIILENFSELISILNYNRNQKELTKWLLNYQFNKFVYHHILFRKIHIWHLLHS